MIFKIKGQVYAFDSSTIDLCLSGLWWAKFRKETDRTFVFLSNNFELSAGEIAYLYKNRWQVGLFFKWIKQHLKIKAFWGASENELSVIRFTHTSAPAPDLPMTP